MRKNLEPGVLGPVVSLAAKIILSVLGGGLSATMIMGAKMERLEDVRAKSFANEAMIMKTREGLDAKVDRILDEMGDLKSHVGAIEGELKRIK